MKFFVKHIAFTLENPQRAWVVVKALAQYREEHPVCEITGLKPVEVHHIKPVELFPELASDPSNFISLYRRSGHFILGHAGNWNWYVENIRETGAMMKIVKPSKES